MKVTCTQCLLPVYPTGKVTDEQLCKCPHSDKGRIIELEQENKDLKNKYILSLKQIQEYSDNDLIIIDGKTLVIKDELKQLENA